VSDDGRVLVVLALVTAVVLGALLAVVASIPVAAAVAAVVLVAGVAAQRSRGAARRGIGIGLLAAVVLGGSYLALTAVTVLEALTTTEGVAEAADAGALEAARDKIAGLQGVSSFRLELTESELQAVVQDGVAADPDLPISRVDLDLRGGGGAAPGTIAFTASFKAGTLTATGTAEVVARDGGIALDLGPLDFGPVRVPGVARGAVESLLGAVTDLNGALAAQDTTVQQVEVTDDALVVIGVRTGGALTGGDLLEAIRAQASVAADAVQAPAEVLGPGRVAARDAPGHPVVLALGDSLAAGAGVTDLRDSYASRFHRAVEARDGATYGLRNLGVAGETSASLVRDGQLDRAEAVLASPAAAYVTLDIGANDLLGHLLSPDCEADLRAAACQERVAATLETYRTDLAVALDRLVAAAGDAPVVLLTAYNPFSLVLSAGSPGPQEAESSAMLARLNDVAADVAGARGVLVADGFTPLQGTTAATTHMLDPVPDIHPNAAGHDVLATALFRAVGGQV
jgi:lysophospholipase L1-like esterase